MGRGPEAGYSLVEVMAALAILAIAMTAVFATFTTQQQTFVVQGRVAEMQQNLRQAVEYMSRDIRLAGYGTPDNVTIPNGVVAAGITSVRSIYAKDNTAGPDQVYVLYMFDMDTNQPPTTDNALGVPANAGSITVPSTAGFQPGGGEFVLVTDGATADLYQTTAAGGTTLTFGGGLSYNAGHTKSYASGGVPPVTVAKARFARYYIDTTTDPDHPTLMVDRMAGAPAQPVADDIEDLQLEYGLDTSVPTDGVVDNVWTSNPSYTQIALARQVRLRVMARSRFPEKGWNEIRPALGNHPAGTASDGYRRRIYDIVIDLRNSGV